MDLKSFVTETADFPKPGILFRDISPLLREPAALSEVVKQFEKIIHTQNFDYIAGIESRGFILGMLLAQSWKKGFIPVRKAGKLPPPVFSQSYALEYGHATLELQPGKGRVLLIDDVLATGGTLQAALQLCEQAGYEVSEVAVLIQLSFLNKMDFKGSPIKHLIRY